MNDSDEEVEDWDLEIEDDDNISRSTDERLASLKSMLFPIETEDEDSKENQEIFPSKFKLIKDLDEYDTTIKFPIPSNLYSLRTKTGLPFLKDTKLESYIVSTASVSGAQVFNVPPDNKWKEFNDSLESENQDENIQWAHLACQCCWLWFYRKETTFYAEKLVDMFILRLKEQNLNTLDSKSQAQLFYICLQVMRFVGQLKSLSHVNKVPEIKEEICNQFPSQTDYVNIVQVEILYDNLKHLAKRGEIGKNLSFLLEIFDRKFEEKSKQPETNIYETVYYEYFPSDDLVAAHALFILQCFFSYISPLTLKSMDEMWSSQFSIEDSSWEGITSLIITSQPERIKILKRLYSRINIFSPLKASMAEVLGMYYRHIEGNASLAEQLFFESIFILDHTKNLVEEIPTICRETGIQCLKEYGDVLLGNSKYRFGIAAHESSLKVFEHVYGTESQAIVRKLAVIATDNNDWRRSLHYYRKIHSKAQQESNINEIVYVSEVLSSMFLERGDFRNAESYISKALQYVPTTKGKIDALALQLKLKLANLYLHGYYFERGIELLARLLDQGLPNLQKSGVIIHLAEAYLKKRWLKECESVLNKMSPCLDQPGVSVKIGISTNNNESDAAKAIEIAARCYYHQKKYTYSLFWVDEALRRCQPSNLWALGRYFFLKGKIFQALCLRKHDMEFPTNLQPENIQRHPLYQQLQTTRALSQKAITKNIGREIYNSRAELLYDCIRCYKKAYEYFHTISDEIRVAKAAGRIARTQLDYIIGPSALVNGKPGNISQVKVPKFSAHKQAADEPVNMSLSGIEYPITLSLEIAIKAGSITLALEGYITMAELRYLEGQNKSSQAFWEECRRILFQMFMDGPSILVAREAPPGFMSKLYHLLKRLVRLLLCYDTQYINSNLIVIDAFLKSEIDLDQVKKRPVGYQPEPFDEEDFPSSVSTEDTNVADNSPKPSATRPNTRPQHQRSLSANAVAMHFDMEFDSSKKKMSCSEQTAKNNKVYSEMADNPKKNFLRFKSKKRKGPTLQANRRPSFYSEDKTTLLERGAERAWSCLFRMKQHCQMFANGGLSEEEVSRANQSSLRKLANFMHKIRKKEEATDDFPKILTNNDSPREQPLHEVEHQETKTLFSSELLNRCVYILHFDDILFYYVPSKGTKKFHQFGGEVETEFDTLDGNIDPVEETENTSTHSSKSSRPDSRRTLSLRDIYIDTYHSELESETVSQPQHINVHTTLDKWIASYIKSLVVRNRRETLPGSIVEASALLAKIFPGPFNEICEERLIDSGWYTSVGQSRKRSGSIFKMFSSQSGEFESLSDVQVSDEPVLVLCSKSLQTIPWELLIQGDVSRNFGLYWDIRNQQDFQSEHTIPSYFCCFSEDDSKHISPVEQKRKDWIFKKQMHAIGKAQMPITIHESLFNLPFHTPLVRYGKKASNYQRKYRYIHFLELGSIIGNPTELVSSIDKYLEELEFPVFIFTYADLLDVSEAALQLIQYRPDCTLLFVPEAGARDAAKLLMKMQENYLRCGDLGQGAPTEHRYKFLMSCIRKLRREEQIPVVIVNPPLARI
eukprot:gb/GECH01003922.1/.p1 GENE.gb/GECH01003922.1/~~gb/GECH01003922.1/.p1  ORF type:complete len:1560 (+),score=344.98 gb/GECH01003922.1/:1-4680(+)